MNYRTILASFIISSLLVVVALTFLSCATTKVGVNEITQVKVYFMFSQNHPTDCICNDPVIRKVHKTTKVEEAALIALNELVKGTTKEESAKGYGRCIPAEGEVARYKKWYMESIKNYQKSDKINESGKQYLNSEGKFTPWGDRVSVISVEIKDSVAYANFSKELYSYGGGSCRVVAIASSIVNTLKQFPQVKEVVILVEEREAELEP